MTKNNGIIAPRAHPHNAELELEAIGKLIESPTYIYDMYLSQLTERDFYAFPEAWNFVSAAARRDESVSIGLIVDHLRDVGADPLTENDKVAMTDSNSADTQTITEKLQQMTRSRIVIQAASDASVFAFGNKPDKAIEMLDTVRDAWKAAQPEIKRDKHGDIINEEVDEFLFPTDETTINTVPMFGKELNKRLGGFPRGVITTVLARPSMGKALKDTERVLTNNGWIPISELNPKKDRAIGSDGKSHAVLGVFPQGVKKTMRVRFDDDTEVVCCEEHLWTVRDGRSNTHKTMDTLELKRRSEIKSKYFYLPPAPIIAKGQKDMDEDLIYFMGVWIASGRFLVKDKEPRGIRISTFREDVAKQWARIAARFGGGVGVHEMSRNYGRVYYNLSFEDDSQITKHIYSFTNNRIGANKLSILRRALELSVAQRYVFLRGMVDAIGHMDKSANIIMAPMSTGTVLEQINNAVIDVARSLGFKAMPGKGYKDDMIRICQAWTLEFSRGVKFAYPDPNYKGPRPLFRFSQDVKESTIRYVKKYAPSHYRDMKDAWPYQKRVVSIKEEGESSCTCISVDSTDRLFITEGYTLTHNTRFLVASAIYAAIWAKVNAPGQYFVQYFSQDGAPRMIIGSYVVARYGYTLKNWVNDRKKGVIPGIIRQKVQEDIKAIADLPLVWNDSASMTPIVMREKIRDNARELGARPLLVIGDYLQNYKPSAGTKANSRTETLVLTMEQFYEMVRTDDEYALVMATQVSRDVANRENKRPRMGDGKGASEIEEKSEMVISLHRESYYTQQEDYKGEIGLLKDKTGDKDLVVNMEFRNGLWIPQINGWEPEISQNSRDLLRIQDGTFNAVGTPASGAL